jgi:hypothetical protein
MGMTDAEGAPTGQELLTELILAYLASGCRVNRTQAAAALSELISVGLLTCGDGRYSLSLPKAPAPASPPASHRRGGPPHRNLPTPTSVLFWRRSSSCKPTKEIGQERAPSTPAIPGSGKVYIILLDDYLSMSPIPKHTVCPSPLRRPAVCPTQDLALPVRCPPLTVWPRGHSRSAIQVLFLLSCLPSAVCGFGALRVLVCWEDSIISTYKHASAATRQPKTASAAVAPSTVCRRLQFDVGHNGR